MRKLILILMTTFSLHGYAAQTLTDLDSEVTKFIATGNWTVVSAINKLVVFLNNKSVISGPTAKAWLLYNYLPESDTNRKVLSYKSYEHFQCAVRKSATAKAVLYSGQYGGGEILKTDNLEQTGLSFAVVVLDSISEDALEMVCNYGKKASPPQGR